MMRSQGESPYASFTDLLVSLVFIFLLLVAVLAINVRPLAETEGLPDKLAKLTSGLGDRLRDRGVAVRTNAPNGRLMFGAEVLFPVGSADLTPEGVRAVEELARQLRRVLPPHVRNLPAERGTPVVRKPLSIDTILIEGHADASPIRGSGGRFRNNRELSTARAGSVLDKLLGFVPELATARSGRIANKAGQPLFGTAGYGATRPVQPGLPTTDPAHRRVEIRIIAVPPND